MIVTLVGRDKAPSQAFELLIPVLERQGHTVRRFLGNGKPMQHDVGDVRASVRDSDIVLCGMSSSEELAAHELAACDEAGKRDTPHGFYGDTFHCHQRARRGAWFAPHSEGASFFLAINGEEAHAAGEVFPHATCVATGNPTWEDFATPAVPRETVRERLGIRDDERLILSPGGKSPMVNALVWGLAIDGLARLDNVQLMLACHPGDRTLYAMDREADQELNIYGDLANFAGMTVRFADRDAKTSHLLPGADLVVEWGSTIAIQAAHLRIPVVSITTHTGRVRMESTSGTQEWELANLGVTRLADPHEHVMHDVLEESLDPTNSDTKKMLARQEAVFPASSEPDAAVAKMASALAEAAG